MAFVHLIDFIPSACHVDLTNGNGVYIDGYLENAIAKGLGVIIVPRGQMKFVKEFNLETKIHLRGESTGGPFDPVSEFIFDEDEHGIIVHPSGAGSIIEGLGIRPASQSGTTGHGVWLRGAAQVKNCRVDQWPGNAVHIVAYASHMDETKNGDARGWSLDTVRLGLSNTGLYVEGDQAHKGRGIGLDLTQNDNEGLYDNSVYGNQYFGCHSATNAMSYRTEGADNRSSFTACYQEGGQAKAVLSDKTTVFGGFMDDVDLSTGVFRARYDRITPFSVFDANEFWELKVNTVPNNFLNMVSSADTSNTGLSYRWDDTNKVYDLAYDDSIKAMEFTTATTTYEDNTSTVLPHGQVVLPGVWSKNNADNRYSFFDFADVLDQLADHENRITALEP